MNAALRARLDDDRGFSLVELLTVMVLILVTSGIAYSGMSTLFRQTVHAEQRISAVTTMQTVLGNMTREVRAAARNTPSAGPLVRQAGPGRIQFEVFRDLGLATDPSAVGVSRIRFTYRMDGATLLEDRSVWANRTADPATATPTSTTTRPLMFDVSDPAAVFRFRDADGLCVTGCDGLTASLALPAAASELGRITDVEIYLGRELGGDRGIIDVEAKVRLRNAR